MKKYFLILWFLPALLFSQNNDPSQIQFSIDTSQAGNNSFDAYISSDLEYFKQNRFYLGWHWGFRKTMSHALNMNGAHTYDWEPANVLDTNSDIIMINSYIETSASGTTTMQSQAIQYEPTLKLDEDEPWQFKTNENDPSNPIFGFKTIHSGLQNIDSSRRLTLLRNGSYVSSVNPILKDPWINDQLHFNNYISETNPEISSQYNGKTFYLSINLRRHNPIDDTLGIDPVLKIRLPFINKDSSSGYIKFNKVPSVILNDTISITSNLGEYRGTALNLQNANNPTEITITRNMLPVNSRDITISAYFICDDENNNQLCLQTGAGDNDNIKNINLSIKYLGNCDIELDWIRIETPVAQKLFRGGYDSLIHARMQSAFNHFKDQSFKNKNIRPFRAYLRDEPNAAYWAAFRYFNKLVGNIGTTSAGSLFPKHYEYYTGIADNWISFSKIIDYISAPFFYRSYHHNEANPLNWKTLGMKNGYAQLTWGLPSSEAIELDTTNSGYEIETKRVIPDNERYSIPTLRNMSINSFKNYIEGCYSWQGYWDDIILNNLIGYEHSATGRYKSADFLFSNKNWWAQTFVGANFNWELINNKVVIINSSNRPKTGEEMRAINWQSIILGAKGLIYDREEQIPGPYWTGLGHGQDYYQIHGYDALSNTEFLWNDDIGADFIKKNEFWRIDSCVDFSTVSEAMRVDTNRIYLGRKSTRIEIKKIHDYIRENERELMDLQLQAWYGQGFHCWYRQHPDLDTSSNFLEKFISLNSPDWQFWKTAKDDDYNFSTMESWDTAFFDITILKNKNTQTDTTFYIGIQNRRTDPLVLYPGLDVDPDIEDNYMRFFTTAELEDSCAISPTSVGHSNNPQLWRKYWWKRQGCRKFVIPFKYKFQSDTTEYCLLKITELGGDLYHTPDSLKWWWRAPQYYNYIDTTIGQDRDLVVRLLPGEGKILKVEVLHPARNIVGFLDHSNQTKIVAYPVIRQDGIESDSIRYHAVYYKPLTGNPSKLGVFYSRSNIISGNSSNENIKWETPEKLLSITLVLFV